MKMTPYRADNEPTIAIQDNQEAADIRELRAELEALRQYVYRLESDTIIPATHRIDSVADRLEDRIYRIEKRIDWSKPELWS